MKKAGFFLVIVLACLIASSAAAQAPQKKISAEEVLRRAGLATATDRVTTVADAAVRQPVAFLRTAEGDVAEGSAMSIILDIVGDYSEVTLVGQTTTTSNFGLSPGVLERPYFLPKDIALTAAGPGWFPTLSAGGYFPLGKIPTVEVADLTTLEVFILDSRNGARVVQSLLTSFWSQTRPKDYKPRVKVSTLGFTGKSVVLGGIFPVGEQLFGEIGSPPMDMGTFAAISKDGKSLTFPIPESRGAGFFYPIGLATVVPWTVVVMTADGECFTFPRVAEVAGSDADYSLTVIK